METKLTAEEIKQREERNSRRAQHFKEAHFGSRYSKASLALSGNFRKQEELETILRWWEKSKNFLILLGPPGTGKTWLCAALVELAFKKFDTVRYWSEASLLRKIRQGFDHNHDMIESIKYATDDQFMFLDDVGSNMPTDFRKDVLTEVIDQRYRIELPTVITSNLNRKQFKEIIHERVEDRIFAAENTFLTFWGDESFRVKGM